MLQSSIPAHRLTRIHQEATNKRKARKHMTIKVNLSETKEISFEPIPKGTYHGQIESVSEDSVSQGVNEGKPYLTIKWNIVGGEHDGHKVFDRVMLFETGKGSLSKFKNFIAATNLADPDGEVELDPEDFHGAEAMLVVRVRPGNDQYDPSNDVARYKELSEEESLLP